MDPEQKKRIEEIMAGMECEKDFECYKTGFEKLCKTRDTGLPGYVDCLEEKGTICEFQVPFGRGVYCRCPLRVYIAKEVKI